VGELCCKPILNGMVPTIHVNWLVSIYSILIAACTCYE
jgi:hypothetical protein